MADAVSDHVIEQNHVYKPHAKSQPRHCGMPAVIVSFGCVGFFSWGLYTVIVSQISTIEKAFGLSSAESGWLLTVWEIGFIACITLSSYFSPKAHIPRAIGFVTIICGISGIVCILPHFVVFEEPLISASVNSSTAEAEDNLCLSKPAANTTISTDKDDDARVSKKTIAYALFNLAMVLQGIGKGPCHPYSSQYVDDNSKKQNTGLNMSIIWSISIFGLAAGYAIGSVVSKLYVTLGSTDLLTTDSRFIGAWWLGFLCLGVCTLLTAVPMFFFPRHLQGSNKAAIQRQKQPHRNLPTVVKELKGMARTLFDILKTPVYTLVLVGGCFQILAFATFFGFEPKYMESQFAVPPWKANIIIGVASIMSYSIGSVIGGYMTKKVKMSPYVMMRNIVALIMIVNIIIIVIMFIGCPSKDIYTPLDATGSPMAVDCDCIEKQFLPICGADGRNYFSPCHAGCANGTLTEFSECSLIPGGTAVSGLCSTGCNMVWVYAVVRFVSNMIESVVSVPLFLVSLRSAGEEKKAFAVGLSAATTSLVSWLPGPVIGGMMVDSTCLVWKIAATSGQFCGHYDTDYQRKLLNGVQFGIRMFGLVFTVGAMLVARKIPDWNEETKPDPDGGEDDETDKALVI